MSFPLIITGMHRSGTSLMTSLVQALGVDVGSNLFEADRNNVKGYFEDVDFLEFQRLVLQASCNVDEPGWPDWGWTESGQLDTTNFYKYTDEAQQLINSRQNCNGMWGWKDPRTALMLDFWHQLLPEARYLLVYRLPWDTADSILRLHSPIFSNRPDYAIKTWCFYNQKLLDFYKLHPEKCLLINVNQCLANPEQFVELLTKKFNLQIPQSDLPSLVQSIYSPNLFKSLDLHHPTVKLLQEVYPECTDILTKLDKVADLPSDFTFNYNVHKLDLQKTLELHYLLVTAEESFKDLVAKFSAEKEKLDKENHLLRSEIAHKYSSEKLVLEQQNAQLKGEIAAMKTSKFWQLREQWFRLKKLFF